MVAGTARWASQHYRSWISHGFQKLPTYIYIYISPHSVYVCLCLCAATGLYGDPPLHLASRELSSLAKRSRWGRQLLLGPLPLQSLDSIPSRKGKGVIICSSYGPSPSISFQLFSPFLLFLYSPLKNGFYLPIDTRRGNAYTLLVSRLIASPPVLFSAG